jgi:hypothetical protein
MTNKQWTFASLVLAALLTALAIFGGGYRAVGVLFLPLGLWLSLGREPEQRQIRPAIRVLGWLFVGFAVVALVGSLIAITAGR